MQESKDINDQNRISLVTLVFINTNVYILGEYKFSVRDKAGVQRDSLFFEKQSEQFI